MNSSIVLTLSLLLVMFGAGFSSASWGFKLGREALKGITQPDTRPTNNLTGTKGNSDRREKVVMLQEDKIIKNVKNTILNGGIVEKQTAKKEGSEQQKPKANSAQSSQSKQNFPIVSRDAGVVLEVNDIRQWGNSLVLDVNLKNEGDQAVRFLYSFLNITDEQGRVLSASTEDLPGELPPNGRRYYGIITIPITLLDDAKEISLELTDYPNQKLDLKMSKIKID